MSSKRIVLVVDDDREMCKVVGDILERRGYEVRFAHEGKSAYEIVLDDYIDAVVLDVRMPGGSGADLIEDIQEIPFEDRPHLFVMTGYDDFSEREAKKRGVVKFLRKPFRVQGLANALDSVF